MKTTFCLATAIVVLAVLTPLAHAVDPTAWNTKINGPGRFTVLAQFNKEAVFDKETRLVWERSPTAAPAVPNTFTWEEAQFHCNALTVANRKGWRLPTIQELASVVDPTQFGPSLPDGNPFSNVQSAVYWSATTRAGDAGQGQAWAVYLLNAFVGFTDMSIPMSVWCVRGGQGVDAQ